MQFSLLHDALGDLLQPGNEDEDNIVWARQDWKFINYIQYTSIEKVFHAT